MTTLASSPAGHQTMGRLRDRSRWTGPGFIGPFTTVLAVVLPAPIVRSLRLSLFRTQLVSGTLFVGFDNHAMGHIHTGSTPPRQGLASRRQNDR